MKKQSGQLLILLIVLVVLAAAFFGLKQYNKVQSEKPEESTAETIVDVAKEDVVKLTYDYEGETYSFEKADDTWYYAEDHSLALMQYLISNMLSQVAPLEAEQIIENVTDMAQYGLDEPSRTISYETENASYIFQVGNYNSVTSVYYICKPSENTVYAVSSGVVSIFNKTLDDLLDTVESTEETGAETQETEAETQETGVETQETEAETQETEVETQETAEDTEEAPDAAAAGEDGEGVEDSGSSDM